MTDIDPCPPGPCEHFKCEDCRHFVDVVIRNQSEEIEELSEKLVKAERELRTATNKAANANLGRMHVQHRAQVAETALGRTLVDSQVMHDLVCRLHAALQNERDRHSDVSDEEGYWAETDEILHVSYDWT